MRQFRTRCGTPADVFFSYSRVMMIFELDNDI